ncbi:MAG: 3-hydroxybutyryl-CoA dehydrogenase, partial [bacterium]|nr:3-hydroxybutyryl-CoA dehydrogenase [bacterium]
MMIGILGTGALGSGISQVAALNGHRTVAFDIDTEALINAKDKVEGKLSRLVEKGKIENDAAKNALSRIDFTDDLSCLKKCDFVIEAVTEELDTKQKLFKKTESVVNRDCIIASNTSSLSIASISSVCKHPGKIIGTHFFNPAPVMPLVEIIPAMLTDDGTVTKARDLIDSWGKTTVIAKDTPGFIVNRIARPFYGEALRIYEEGLADFSTIDHAMKEIGGFPMGPFELMDFIGNDVSYKT